MVIVPGETSTQPNVGEHRALWIKCHNPVLQLIHLVDEKLMISHNFKRVKSVNFHVPGIEKKKP